MLLSSVQKGCLSPVGTRTHCAPPCTSSGVFAVPIRQQCCVVARAVQEDPSDRPPSNSISKADAIRVLEVSPNATFDQIMDAKKRLLETASAERSSEVEAAYDVLFMSAMKQRLSGEVAVSTRVRYADVPSTKARKPAPQPKGVSASLPGGLNVAVQVPSKDAALKQSAVFGTLAVWSLAQASS